jgi:small-conductance mechanosensitive channel
MMKNFATKPAVKTVFLLAGICLALFMAVQWIFALGTPGPVSWAIAGMIAITLLTLFLGIIPLTKLSPAVGYVTAAALAVIVLIFVFIFMGTSQSASCTCFTRPWPVAFYGQKNKPLIGI